MCPSLWPAELQNCICFSSCWINWRCKPLKRLSGWGALPWVTGARLERIPRLTILKRSCLWPAGWESWISFSWKLFKRLSGWGALPWVTGAWLERIPRLTILKRRCLWPAGREIWKEYTLKALRLSFGVRAGELKWKRDSYLHRMALGAIKAWLCFGCC